MLWYDLGIMCVPPALVRIKLVLVCFEIILNIVRMGLIFFTCREILLANPVIVIYLCEVKDRQMVNGDILVHVHVYK